MATYNGSTKGRMRTTNKSGHAAYKLGDKEKLVTMALTTMLGEPKFYGDNTDELVQLAERLCKSGHGEFVAKLAVWARTTGNLRSVSHALIAITGRHCSGQTSDDGESFVRKAARDIALVRGDDGTEIVSTYLHLYGKPISHAILRGVRDALSLAKPYAIAKYQSASREVKLRDVLRLTHPVPAREDTDDAMGECIHGELAVPKSWETELSARGNTAEVWNELISEGKVGYMAQLRNLRNIIQSGADVEPVLANISDREAVRKSRQLPFRFHSAYVELRKAGLASTRVTRAIDAALMASCANIERLPGKTAVLIDVSGSMSSTVSRKSIVVCRDIAAALGAIATHISDDAAVFWFANGSGIVPMTGLSILSDMNAVPQPRGGTDMAAGFDALMASSFDADRIIVLSDNEVNSRSLWWRGDNQQIIQTKLTEYRKKVGHDVWCHAIDLQGYGTSQFIGEKTNIMAGWSEQVLRFVSLAERGFGGIVADVEAMEL